MDESPVPRHGHCQIVIDDYNVLVIGGASVIRGINNDVFLLTFDKLCGSGIWTKIKINNKEYWPPHVWGIRGCQVGKNVVFLSRPHRVERPALTPTPSIASSSSGSQSRLASPDSPQDRRAVAAAFSSAQRSQGLTASAALRRKAQFLTSKSLDEQKNDPPCSASNGFLSVSPQNPPSTQHPRGIELQRACSIPAIIVGEIPKLVVTDDLSAKSSNRNGISPQSDSSDKSEKTNIDVSRNSSSTSLFNDESDLYNRLCVFSLDTSNVLTDHEVTWRQQQVESNAPPLLILYSIVEANGELVVFGGMKDPTTLSNPFLQANSFNEPGAATNQTYLLKPDYFQI
uniref:Uncharacterized protein n=1 Tax=Panagrellus redivivus TaxID=6233 RepID=A0A7E4ZZP6_PANRE